MTNDDKYKALVEMLKEQPLLPNGTREILDPATILFDPFVQLKRAKQGYVDAELEWYRSMDLNIKGHPKIEDNPIWQGCATPSGRVNSNYGWCVFSQENYDQYKKAVDSLLSDIWTRQSCCIYVRPQIQYDHNDGVNAKHDFICTFCTHHFIRENKLEYIVYMRSNDIEFGLPYDLAWHQYVYKNMYNDLIVAGEYSDRPEYKHLGIGSIHWHATSLHKYERESKAGASLA